MTIKPIKPTHLQYATKHNLQSKLEKQTKLFKLNPRHPSLNTEIIEPKSLRLYSFRLDRKYRAIFIFTSPTEIEIIDINDHYQ
jgi:plasmid maintenance system killer protein